ncbi:zinc transport system substrate-binding protein [Antricoccus suffuscus]|uniref:Zinc transport system substrate-binding protein n=1 Tax=Antricoccus suffuscus TaxID=1629062 RepID=A0A2T0Z4V9_9ACTN|nr:metal ABC transporter substrate-binding protein [Antricoccus suffuscus]PRZ31375.1 zinc transport system substrate-binding protein [Antricoccus suffuscus]
MNFSRRSSRHAVAVVALSAALGVAASALTGCSSAGATSDGKPNVVVGFYPQEFLATSIGGNDIHVTSVAQPGAEPHDMEITGKQVAKVTDAGLVIYIKGIMPALDNAVANNNSEHGLNLATVTTLKGGYKEIGQENGKAGKDPHIWLDPVLMKKMATAVGDRLVKIDKAHAATYKQNTATLIKKLDALDSAYKTGLANCERTSIVTTHNAFGYLAEQYGLTQVSIAGLSPDNEPSPQRMTEVKTFAQEHGVTTIFFEEAVNPKYAETIASEVGAQTAVLSPIEIAHKGEDYITIMQANLAALRKALGCS